MTAAPSPSRRKAWLLPLVRRYVGYRLRRAFEGVFVSGLDRVRTALAAGPVIVAANHVAFWDPLLVTALDARLGGEGHAVMDAESLARLWYFAALGAVPLRRGDARKSLADLAAAATLLDGPRRLLWIFPQGKQRPAHLRPLGLASGVTWLAERARAVTVPLSISYLHREAPELAAFAAFGAPRPFTSRRGHLEDLERALIAGLDRNDRAATESLEGYDALWPPPRREAIPLAGRLLTAARRGRDA